MPNQKYVIKSKTLQDIANAIRTKTGKSNKLPPSKMSEEILSIQTGSADVPFKYGGVNAEKVASYDETYTLADTSLNPSSFTSTSAVSIKASVSNRYTNTTGSPTIAYGDKDIIVVQMCEVIPTYSSDTDSKAQMIKYAIEYISYFSKRKTTDTSAKTTRQVYSMSHPMLKYYNTSSVVTRGYASYGLYMTPQAPSVASATARSTYVRASSPTLNARISTTYMKQENMQKVTDVQFKWHIDVYTVDAFSTVVSTITDDVDGMLINEL